MDARVDEVMGDVLSNGERLAALNVGARPISSLDKSRADEMARILSQARDEQLTWDSDVGGYRGEGGLLRVEIAGVNQPSTENPQTVPNILNAESTVSEAAGPDKFTQLNLFNPGLGLGVYLGAQSAANAMYTRSPALGPYGNLSGTVPGYQAHHLNQNAVYKASIPPAQGLSILLRGNAFTDRGSPHYEAHASLEGWWDAYRSGGSLDRQLPTNAEYGNALKQSLIDGGMSPADARRYAEGARQQRLAAGQADEAAVPRLPRRINQPGGNVVDGDLWAARGLAKNLAMVGRGATVIGAVSDGYSLYSQYQRSVQTGDYSNTYREGIRITGGWAGAAAVGAAGAEFGAGFGMAFTPVGAVVGGFIGGIVGGALGYFGGSYAAVGIANDTGLLRQNIGY
jgi:hypothetical protein